MRGQTVSRGLVGRLPRALSACVLAVALALAGAPAAAGSTLTYSIFGVELAATATEATFAGVAVATDDSGTWRAVIDHTSLGGGSAAITAGAFAYQGKVGGVAGAFTGGGLSRTGGSTGCAKETFAVSGTLALTAPPGATGLFDATLTHYRTIAFGRCSTYFATAKGVVTVTP